MEMLSEYLDTTMPAEQLAASTPTPTAAAAAPADHDGCVCEPAEVISTVAMTIPQRGIFFSSLPQRNDRLPTTSP